MIKGTRKNIIPIPDNNHEPPLKPGFRTLALGGEVNVLALQVEYALNKRLSLVAAKDGFMKSRITLDYIYKF